MNVNCKLDNFEAQNSLKLSLTNIQCLSSNFAECESFFESNFSDILALCEINSTDSGNFYVKVFFPLICMALQVYVKEGLPFAWDLSVAKSAESYLCFRMALLFSAIYFFFFYQSFSLLLHMVFHAISSNIDEVLSINPSANVIVFGDL